MKQFIPKKTRTSSSETDYESGKPITRHFELYCDICGAKHPEVCVNDLCEEEGFPDGDYCWNCQMSMEAQGFVGEDKSVYFPKENKDVLAAFLSWAKEKSTKKLEGFWTYDGDYFSWPFLKKMVGGGFIVLNKEMGKKFTPEKTKSAIDRLSNKLEAEFRSDPWYYKNEGKLFSMKPRSEFRLTRKILYPKDKNPEYVVHADWYGGYFMSLAALPGKTCHEKVFTLREMYTLPAFLAKEKPKGVVLSFVTSDRSVSVYDVDLSPVLDLFVSPNLSYLKLLFVSDLKNTKEVKLYIP